MNKQESMESNDGQLLCVITAKQELAEEDRQVLMLLSMMTAEEKQFFLVMMEKQVDSHPAAPAPILRLVRKFI